MQKIKNKFIILIILILISIIWYLVFNSYLNKNKLNYSYVTLIEWNALLNESNLELDIKELLNIWDFLETKWKDSKAIIEWWDGSLTRLWWNTSLKIEEMYVSSDVSKLNIAFELFNWKTWSNVISFLWEDSYFKEYFNDNVAAARWTIFNVDLENDYIYVSEHNINYTDNKWNKILIKEKTPFDINNSVIIKLESFIRNIKDKDFEKFNLNKDNEFFNLLKEDIKKNLWNLLKIEDIDLVYNLNNDQKEELYNKLLSDYQKIHFIKPDEKDLFEHKIDLKNKLIILAWDENKQRLVENTLYDFNNVIKMKEYENIEDIIFILNKNKELLDKINLNNYIQFPSFIPEDLKNIFEKNILDIRDIFWDNIGKIKNIDLNTIKGNIKNINNNAQDSIHEWLNQTKKVHDNAKGFIQGLLDSLFNK